MKKITNNLQRSLKAHISNKYNSLKDILFSLNCYNVTEFFCKIFELTNQKRERENSKFKNGPNLDQIIVKLGPNLEV